MSLIQKTHLVTLFPENKKAGKIPVSEHRHSLLQTVHLHGKGFVPDIPAMPREEIEKMLDLRCGFQPVFISLAYDHIFIILLVYGHVKQITPGGEMG